MEPKSVRWGRIFVALPLLLVATFATCSNAHGLFEAGPRGFPVMGPTFAAVGGYAAGAGPLVLDDLFGHGRIGLNFNLPIIFGDPDLSFRDANARVGTGSITNSCYSTSDIPASYSLSARA